MALGDLFKKKQQIIPPQPDIAPMTSGPADIPLTQVTSMQAQGLSSNQIIQTLQRQGYPPQSIYDALAQAEAKKSIEPMNIPGETAPAQETRMDAPAQKHPESEVLVEQIIEEKWHELQKDLGKMNEFKELLTSRVDKLEQSVTDLKTDLDGLHKAIVSRIGEYDKTLLDVGTEIKAMEKVFTKVLPDLTSSVQELSRVTNKMKGK
ncbi:hypothetical protein C4580_05875 [Candidatus Woesearchaeota archaeon]|nr:MAG: hypothetical protein C4580_05875 [Candidatus Woesearchaeota archaeon]